MSSPTVNPYESPDAAVFRPAVSVWRRCAVVGAILGGATVLGFAGYGLQRIHQEAATLPEDVCACGSGAALLMIGACIAAPIAGLITGAVGAVLGGLYDLVQRI